MANGDINSNIRVGITPDVRGPIESIKKDLAGLRAEIAKPIRSTIDFDLSGIDKVEKRLKNLKVPKIGGGGEASGLGEAVYGPAVKDRHSPEEKEIRAAAAAIAKGMYRRSKAEEAAADAAELEAKARRELGLSIPKPSARPERQAIRNAEQAALARGGTALTGAESNYSQSRYTPLGGRATGNRMSLATRMAGGAGLGAAANEIGIGGSTLKLEDKLNLGAGNKITGALAVPIAGAITGLALIGKAGEAMALFKDKVAAGASKTDAMFATFGELAKGLPLIGGVIEGLDKLGAELNGDADKLRARAKGDEKANDNKAISDRVQGIRQRGKSVNDDLFGQVATGINESRLRRAAIGDNLGTGVARTQAQIEYENATRPLSEQREELRRRANGNGPDKISNEDFTRASAQIDKIQQQAKEKLIDSLAEADKQESAAKAKALQEEFNQRKANENTLFDARQTMLEAEGKTVQANLEAVDKAAKDAAKEAYARVREVESKFGNNSTEGKAARTTLATQLAAIDQRKNVNRSAIIEEAGRGARTTEIGELQVRAALGDEQAAIRASVLSIDAQTEAREKALKAIADNTALDQATRDAATKDLGELKGIKDKQKAIAKQQIEDAERQRRGGIISDIAGGQQTELRRLAERTGNTGLAKQADAIGLAEEYRQRAEALRQRLTDPALKADERDAIQGQLGQLPEQFQASIGDLTRAKVSSQDFVNASTATAVDAGNSRGYAQEARESAQAIVARQTTEISATLKRIADVVIPTLKDGGTAPIPLPLNYN